LNVRAKVKTSNKFVTKFTSGNGIVINIGPLGCIGNTIIGW